MRRIQMDELKLAKVVHTLYSTKSGIGFDEAIEYRKSPEYKKAKERASQALGNLGLSPIQAPRKEVQHG
jgi:hypothetical protein